MLFGYRIQESFWWNTQIANQRAEASDISEFLSEALLLTNSPNSGTSENSTLQAHMTAHTRSDTPRHMGTWDTDAIPIVVDSATTRTITPRFDDLIEPVPYGATVEGIGKGSVTHRGTVRWRVRDERGRNVLIEDRDAYCSPDAPYRLLCPHSWKQSQDQRRFESGETEGDNANLMLADDNSGYILTWNRGKTNVFVPLDPTTNLPTVNGDEGYDNFNTFASAFHAHPTLIPNDDEMDHIEYDERKVITDEDLLEERQNSEGPQTINFLSEGYVEPAIKIDDPLTPRDKAEFIGWHIRLNHAPFKIIRWAAKQGIIPKKLTKCENVVCPACMYGKQKRRPWRLKGETAKSIRPVTKPGECISVDQLISGTPGLVAQMTGRLTTSRYKVATIFVDHFSGLDYVHVQESTSAIDTIEAKQEFERFCEENGVRIKHYHADNGIFASNGFRQEVQRCGQKLTFCGVGAHHQNGVAERRIQDLSDAARASLAYAAHRNPAVTAHLWPYAV